MHNLPISLLPGECTYSVVARAYISSPYQSWKITNLELFESINVRLNTMLPGHISSLSSMLNISQDELLTHCTAYPLVAFGMADKRILSKMMEHDLYGGAQHLYHDSRLAASKLSFGHTLKGCPICFEQDELQHGIGYWHTIHQCHGVTVCPEHHIKLTAIKAGEGGVNHRYILPTPDLIKDITPGNKAERHLSHYLSNLYELLCFQSPIKPLSNLYQTWLDAKGYLTKAGRVRWRHLQPDLQYYWQELFNQQESSLPLELCGFNFVPRLVHHDANVHYIKHALLMGFLSQSPALFFRGPLREVNPQENITTTTLAAATDVLSLLAKGLSMRQVASRLHCSVGYIKQLALREGFEIDRRRQFITPETERAIWRNALLGEHRGTIASTFNVSVGSVEQIIQSHAGLSQWRHHLRIAKRKIEERKLLLRYMRQHSEATRSKIKSTCGSYMWLYRHDRDWLYKQLPPALQGHFRAPINWHGRDLVVLTQLHALKGEYASMSAIDRAVGGHSWLIKMRKRFPLSYAYALELLTKRVK
ncbi:TnsD family Tn7-like transposition protein [Vibrio natriegens]|uniref:TnsD family Tn7-like transposition protein n=1 Tax=Vibrio natriegens TaxID=691 RepID=UPI003B5CE7AC